MLVKKKLDRLKKSWTNLFIFFAVFFTTSNILRILSKISKFFKKIAFIYSFYFLFFYYKNFKKFLYAKSITLKSWKSWIHPRFIHLEFTKTHPSCPTFKMQVGYLEFTKERLIN